MMMRLYLLIVTAALSACSTTRQVITVPMAASSDSIGDAVVHELWRYYADLAVVAQSLRDPNAPRWNPCLLGVPGHSAPAPDDCLAYAYSLAEDSVYPRAMLRHTDSLAARLVQLRDRVGAQEMLDETLIFAHSWRRSPTALRVPLSNCDSIAWWCDAVRGMIHHRLGATVEAERHFARMLAAMPPNVSCGWHMLGLLPRATCEDASPARDSLMWWLADPLWLEPGNDRWTEHLSRHVLFRVFQHHDELLRRARKSPQRAKSGVDWSAASRLSLAVRYGFYAVAVSVDADKNPLLRTYGSGAPLRELRGSKYEFTPLDPERFVDVSPKDSSQLTAWPAPAQFFDGPACSFGECLSRPGAGLQQSQRMLTSRGRIRMVRQEGVGVNESYGRHQRFDRVRDFQVVTLPRDSARALYAAYAVSDVAQRPGPMGVAFSRAPTDTITRLFASDAHDDVVRVVGTLPADGGVISLEAVSNPRQVWRHRYYLAADTALDVSPVVLLADAEPARNSDRDEALPTALPLDRMLPRTWLLPTERFVLYWEVSDSSYANTVALEFRRADKSAWQQITGVFRRGADGQSVRVEPGALSPIIRDGRRVGFGLPFTLSGLEPGRYEVRAIARESATGRERAGKATEIELRTDR